MRVLVCGDRNWTAWTPIFALLDDLRANNPDGFTVLEGDAKGADAIAGCWARKRRVPLETYPANWKVYRRGAGPVRNQQMLDSGVDLVLAFHPDLSQSKGTADMVRRARDAGVEVRVFG